MHRPWTPQPWKPQPQKPPQETTVLATNHDPENNLMDSADPLEDLFKAHAKAASGFSSVDGQALTSPALAGGLFLDALLGS